MIQNRVRELTIGITVPILFFLLVFYTDSGNSTNQLKTGLAIEQDIQKENDVLLQGLGFEVFINGEKYYYLYSDDHIWYQSADQLHWQVVKQMGNELWTGLYYLKALDSRIYLHDKEISDVAEFAKEYKE